MGVEFTAHNIRLDDGTFTKPDAATSIEATPWFVSAQRILETVFPGDKSHIRLADVGCLEGGFAVEFARMGFNVLGVEIRESNMAACRYVKSKVNLPNLNFVQDNAFNIANHGVFDAVFCCGLLYHLDKPKQFIETLAGVTSKLVILQTHFSTAAKRSELPGRIQKMLVKMGLRKHHYKHHLSPLTENEGLFGRWFVEFKDDKSFSNRENSKWASWDNRQSFWVQREYLIQTIKDAGFDLVMEQFDSLGPNIADSMLNGYYHVDCRGTFIGVKTGVQPTIPKTV